MHVDGLYSDPVGKEVVELHQFFEEWYTGTCAGDPQAHWRHYMPRFDPGFCVIPPTGLCFRGPDFWPLLHRGYGAQPRCRFSIRNVRKTDASTDATIIAVYEEWRQNTDNLLNPASAVATHNVGRVTTVVFRPDLSMPNGLTWLHVHESWLPRELVEAEPFDW